MWARYVACMGKVNSYNTFTHTPVSMMPFTTAQTKAHTQTLPIILSSYGSFLRLFTEECMVITEIYQLSKINKWTTYFLSYRNSITLLPLTCGCKKWKAVSFTELFKYMKSLVRLG
jgi:uncharacterized membrane protein